MIVCVGDSITYGQFLDDPSKAWPHLLRGFAVHAAGVPGDTTRLGLERFPQDVQRLDPSVVVIQFGHNDANRWLTDAGLPRVSEKAFVANLEEMFTRCRTFGARPYMCSLTPSFRSEQHAADVAHYDGLIRWTAKSNGVPLIDVRKAFLSDRVYLMSDGLHLTEQGHEAYAATVQRALEGEPSDPPHGAHSSTGRGPS